MCSLEHIHMMMTCDVRSLYTSITQELAIEAILHFIPQTEELLNPIILGVKLLLDNNYFKYNNQIYKQDGGVAMGTNAAPQIAHLFLAYYEETLILPKFQKYFKLYKRYLDDLLVLAKTSDKNTLDKFVAELNNIPGISWTTQRSTTQITFLDLEIFKGQPTHLETRTHQKELNLYSYPAFVSAHPRHSFTGMIHGILKK